jgi:hypothetical protein
LLALLRAGTAAGGVLPVVVLGSSASLLLPLSLSLLLASPLRLSVLSTMRCTATSKLSASSSRVWKLMLICLLAPLLLPLLLPSSAGDAGA